MKPDHPQYGPQLDNVDGTIGRNIQLVVRYVLVSGPYEKMWSTRQGRFTKETCAEAEEWCRVVKEANPNHDLVPKDLRVAPIWCYPGHFDPVGRIEPGPVLDAIKKTHPQLFTFTTSLKERILLARKESPRVSYHDLMLLVFPPFMYPRAWKRSCNGGPPGCCIAFGKALRELGIRRNGHNLEGGQR